MLLPDALYIVSAKGSWIFQKTASTPKLSRVLPGIYRNPTSPDKALA